MRPRPDSVHARVSLVSMGVAVLVACGIVLLTTSAPLAQEPPPNVVLINADDLSYDMLYDNLESFPNIKHLGDTGLTFSHYYVTDPWCCPSRSTLFTGLYTHNHGVWYVYEDDGGGWQKYESKGWPTKDLSVSLKRSGVTTGLFGKYLNDYRVSSPLPSGWDKFLAFRRGDDLKGYPIINDYPLDFGRYGRAPNGQTHTEVIAQEAADWVKQQNGPFFAYVAPYAPHNPGTVHPEEYESLFTETPLPKGGSYNEADVSDKPAWIRKRPRITDAQEQDHTEFYRKMLRSTKDVDDLVGTVVGALRESGKLDNTYVIFTSDNGFHMGEHRLLPNKRTPYEEDTRQPLIVAGPSVPSGARRTQLVTNNDLAPTISRLLGASLLITPDGRSFKKMLSSNPAASTRKYVLLEGARAGSIMPEYRALRSRNNWIYVRYETGDREYYDLVADPYQLENGYEALTDERKVELDARLNVLEGCARKECRAAENGDYRAPKTSIDSGPDGPTNDKTPTFSFSATDDASSGEQLRYSYRIDKSEWSRYSSETNITLGGEVGLADGPHTFYVKAKDAAGIKDLSPAQRDFTVDTKNPSGTVVINGGRASTASRTVRLKLSAKDPAPATGVAYMSFRNGGTTTWSRWQAYSTSKSWTLSRGGGKKTVYVQYKDRAGNVSATASDSITYRP